MESGSILSWYHDQKSKKNVKNNFFLSFGVRVCWRLVMLLVLASHVGLGSERKNGLPAFRRYRLCKLCPVAGTASSLHSGRRDALRVCGAVVAMTTRNRAIRCNGSQFVCVSFGRRREAHILTWRQRYRKWSPFLSRYAVIYVLLIPSITFARFLFLRPP